MRQSPYRIGLILGLVLLVLGLLLNWVYRPIQIRSEVISVSQDNGQTLVGRLYTSQQIEAPYPTLMLWHGVSCTKETLELWAIELARQGVAVLAFDAGGFGESYHRAYNEADNLADARAIATYVYSHPEQFDPTQIGVGGHSMGGATALFLASEDSRIKTAIVLGMSADITRNLPPNLLMGIGLYEQFHTPYLMRSMLQQGTEQSAKEFQLYGDFAKSTARKLVISSTSDHLIEPFDPTLIRETVTWVKQVFNINLPTSKLIVPGFVFSQFLILLGTILIASYGLRDSFYAQNHPRQIAIGFTAIGLLILTLGMVGQLSGRLATDLILLTAIALPISNYAITQTTRLTAFFRILSLYIILVVGSYAMLAVMLQGNELIAHPTLVLGLPQFMLQMPIALIYSRMHEVRAALFPVHSNGLVPSWTLILLFLPELIKPGIVLQIITQTAVWIAHWLRQPLQISHWRERPSNRSLKVLAGLVVLLLIVLHQQLQSGALSLEYAWSAAKLQVQMVLLPALMIFGMMRSRLLQEIETRCWKS